MLPTYKNLHLADLPKPNNNLLTQNATKGPNRHQDETHSVRAPVRYHLSASCMSRRGHVFCQHSWT